MTVITNKLAFRVFRGGVWHEIKFRSYNGGTWNDLDFLYYNEYDPPVPLWTKVPTSLSLNGTIYEGEAFEVPELHRVIHTVELNGLTPDTVYDFALPDNITALYTTFKGDPSENMVVHWQTQLPVSNKGYSPNLSNTYKFKTLPATLSPGSSLKIISGGDIAATTRADDVFDFVKNHNPDIFVISGDIAYADNTWNKRANWHRFWEKWLARIDRNEPIVPIVAGIGNHEIGDGSGLREFYGARFNFEKRQLGFNTWFATQFAFPENSAYGVIDVGNYLSLVMLDTEHASPVITGTDEQTVWLQDVLNNRQTVKHVLPFMHVSAYPATRSYSEGYSERIRQHWTPLFEAHGGIKYVFEHHDHVYKRTVPIKMIDGVPTEHPDGIVYLGNGAMGVAIRDAWNPNTTWYLEDVKATTYVKAQSGETHPTDGQPGYDETVDEAWHMYETIIESDKKTITTYNTIGGGGAPYHTIVQEVDHV